VASAGTSRRWLAATLGIALALILGRAVASLYVDYLWYEAMGAVALWKARAVNAILLRGGAAVVGAAFVFANLFAVRGSVASFVLPRRMANLEIGEEVPGRYLVGTVVVLSAVIGGLLALALPEWTALGLPRYGLRFNETETYFELDLGFYTYWLPLERALYSWAFLVLLVVATTVVTLYALTPSLRWERGVLRVSTYVRRHLTALGAVLLLLLAWSYRLDGYIALVDGSGADGAFGWTDHMVLIPTDIFLAVVTAAAAALVVWTGWTGQGRLTFGAVTAVLVLAIVGRHVLPVVARRLAEPSDPELRERPYIATREVFTRRAYDLGVISHADAATGFTDLAAAALGTPLWEPAPLSRAVERARRIGATVPSPGWRWSPRGVVAEFVERAPQDAPGVLWTLVRVLATDADGRGGPVRVDSLGRPADEDATLPPVVVHDSARGDLLVSDPGGRYAAVPLESFGSRLAHAWSRQNPRLLLGDLPQPGTRIFMRRDVRHRVQALVPFFTLGSQLVPVVDGDSLFWVVHLYAASRTYPLTAHARFAGGEYAYAQHAAVAAVNAHTGRVTIVADSALDPLARTWVRRFPSLFSAPGALPPALASRIPPATDGAMARAHMFARYGLLKAHEFEGHVVDGVQPDSADGDPAPALLVLPGGGNALRWPIPVLDAADRLRGLLVAGGETPQELRWYALARPGPRWATVAERLRRAADSAGPARTARDARVSPGRLRAVPVGNGVAYVQTSYARQDDATVAVARVTALRGTDVDTVGVGATIPEALALVEAVPGDTAAVATANPATFRARVAALYDAMRQALRRGDWLAFGRAYDALGALLGRAR
jgi:uncharacterized protein